MFKKVLLALMVLSSFSLAKDIDINVQTLIDVVEIKGVEPGVKQDNWVGLYKKGTSVDFKNVIQWYWIKDLWGMRGSIYFQYAPQKSGEYIVRVMTRNYQVLASKEFELKGHYDGPDNGIRFEMHTSAEDHKKGVFGVYITGAENVADNYNWFGVFKKGEPTTYNRCFGWQYVMHSKIHKRKDGSSYIDFDFTKGRNRWISTGDFVIRYLGYVDEKVTVFAESEEFRIEKFYPSLKVDSFDFHEGIGALTMTFNLSTNTGEDNNNWVGIFEKGATSEFKNVIRWAWLRDLRQQNQLARVSELYREFLYGELPNGDYEFRVLTRDYKVIGSAELQVAKQGNAPLKITDTEIIDNGKYLDINFNTEKMNGYPNSNWVAFYPVGSSVDFKNVIHWRWIKDLPWVKASHTKKRLALEGKVPEGDYELRVLDRSYKIIDSVQLNVAF